MSISKEAVYSIILFLFTIGIISTLLYKHSKSLRELNESSKDLPPFDPISETTYLDLNDKQAMENEYKKIRFYESIERGPVRHISPFDFEEKEQSSKFRSLSESNIFINNVSFVHTIHPEFPYTYGWVSTGLGLSNMDPNLFVYPYPFSHQSKDAEGNEKTYSYPQGGYISTRTDYFKNTYGSQSDRPFSFNRAKALFGTDIAILSIVGNVGNRLEELFQDSVDWCTYLTSPFNIPCNENFELYLDKKKENPTKFYSSKLNETAINQGVLDIDGVPRFGILIVPDYKLGTDSIIKSKLGENGKKNILNFYENGGIIIITGKSGTLFEDWGLIKKGTYNRTELFSINDSKRLVGINSCLDLYNKPFNSEENDFEERVLCMSIYSIRRIALSTTFKTINKDESFRTLLEINSTDEKLIITDTKTGLPRSLTEEEKKYNPLVLYKSNEKNGQLFVLNYNPLFKGSHINPAFNTLMLSLSKQIYLTSKASVKTLTGEAIIPAGESGIEIGINTTFQNLYDSEIKDFKIYFFLKDNMSWASVPDNCEKKNDFQNIPNKITAKRSFQSKNDYLFCKLNIISKYDKIDFINKIKILNFAATQMKEKVEILNSIVSFIGDKNEEIIMTDNSRIDCQSPPLIRATINMNPLGTYPIWGYGSEHDNAIKVENKGEGDAFDVEYTGIITLLAPLEDWISQTNISYRLKLYVDYYNKNNYYIPFSDDHTEEDLINTTFLNNKGIVLVADWDAPVLQRKFVDTSKEGEKINILNMNLSRLFFNSTTETLREINYKNSDRFYKIAAQRLMVFVDDTTPEGAKTLYGDNIPIELKDPVFNDRAKIDLFFMRQDIYFYDDKEQNYVYPGGINNKIVFSLDKLAPYTIREKCIKNFGDNALGNILIPGYYTNREEDKKEKIIEPNIWENKLFEVCDLTVIDPTNEEQIIQQFGSLDSFKPVHYIFTNGNENIIDAQQIYNFISDGNRQGHHKDYPEIKFIYLHRCDLILDSKYFKYGGKIIIDIGNYKFENPNQVTSSPDQISINKIHYENGKIIIFFKRGLMSNENYGKNMSIVINIENLPLEEDHNFNITFEELIYDVSSPPEFEKYNKLYSKEITFKYVSAFSLPALQIKAKLNRTVNGLESIEPFTRIGLYVQEMYHRQVVAAPEAHSLKDPSVYSSYISFNHYSQLGMNTIPFFEYVTTGDTYTPSSETTSRIEWMDIWGRKWSQPLKSTLIDFTIGSSRPKDNVMTTTFEILRNGKQILEWPSDENVQIHLHVKLLNNFLKYFEITRCLDNRIRFVPIDIYEGHPIVYQNRDEFEEGLEDEEITGDNMYLREGGLSSYGICYNDKGTVLRGENITQDVFDKIKNMKLCPSTDNPEKIEECMNELKDIPTVNKSPKDWNMTKLWNYSPLVDKFYPEGYITNEMWTMNSYEYEDTDLVKGYKGHLDDQLPNYDNNLTKPFTAIAIPIYKGLGYSITYDQNNEMNYHNVKRKGWWCDNLQNKDDTLLAGQEKSNKISVDKEENIDWIDAKDLIGSQRENSDRMVKEIINYRLSNIYICLFNRKRVKMKKDDKRIITPENIQENNVIPILIDLERWDKRLYEYKCEDEQYSPYNISQKKGNLLETPTDKDYLYFAANLRGAAKESFNVLMNLNYFSKIKYEGMVKVNEGGRFVFYSPGISPNSYMTYDDPVFTIKAKRNDIIIENSLISPDTTTFNSTIYHLYTFKDENKINKEWPYKAFYTNTYGFGDVSVTVNVGGIKKSKPIVQPGETTYAKIIFYNNCGFDWNMKNGSIDFLYKGKQRINAYEIFMYEYIHTIQEPISYNFLNYTVDDRYRDFIDIKPSNHNIEISPEYFDFGSVNVVTIRDGFKGEYDLKITISSNFPDKYRGKPIEIKIDLNTSYFDHFPGTSTDPTKANRYHTYQVKIPSIYIAVPYKDGPFKGKVLYTSAQAKITDFYFTSFIDLSMEAKYVDNDFIALFKNASQGEEPIKNMDTLWETLKNQKSLNIIETPKDENTKLVNITSIAKDYPLFPQVNYDDLDKAEVNVLVRSVASQLKMGYSTPFTIIRIVYKNWIDVPKFSAGIAYPVQAKGPWIEISYTSTLVDYISDDIYLEREYQQLSPAEEGIIKVQYKLENAGNGNAYNVRYQLLIEQNITYFACYKGSKFISKKKNDVGQTLLTFDLNAPINAGELIGGIIYLKYNKLLEPDELINNTKIIIPDSLKVAKESSVIMDLTDKKGEKEVTQVLRKNIVYKYSNNEVSSVFIHLEVSGRRSNPKVEIIPKFKGKNYTNITVYKTDFTHYSSYKEKNSTNYTTEIINKKKGKYIDYPSKIEKNNKNHVIVYTVNIKTPLGTVSNRIKFQQNKIGLSTSEVWLLVISIIFYILTILCLYLIFLRWKNSKSDIENKITSFQSEKLLENDD